MINILKFAVSDAKDEAARHVEACGASEDDDDAAADGGESAAAVLPDAVGRGGGVLAQQDGRPGPQAVQGSASPFN